MLKGSLDDLTLPDIFWLLITGLTQADPAPEPDAENVAAIADDPPATGSNPFDTEPPGLQEEIPVSADPGAAPEAVVDRLAAVRELAGLFDPGRLRSGSRTVLRAR